MSIKDYGGWHIQKATLNSRKNTQYFYEQEVWWLALGCNVGFEEDGKGADYSRPVVIIRKFNQRFFLGVPLSTTSNVGRYYYHLQTSPGFSTALLSQVRPFDSRRLINQVGRVSDIDQAIICHRISGIVIGSKMFSPRFFSEDGGRGKTYL